VKRLVRELPSLPLVVVPVFELQPYSRLKVGDDEGKPAYKPGNSEGSIVDIN